MKSLVIFLLIFFPLVAQAQQPAPITVLTKDTLDYYISYTIEKNWRFIQGDNPAMADTGYDDTKWKIVNSRMDRPPLIMGIGWFRYHFITDSSISDLPLAISMSHYGASEIYLDGKKIRSYGEINGKDSTYNYNPIYNSCIFVIKYPGHHVLAIRYANYDVQHNIDRYDNDMSGFKIKIATAVNHISSDHSRLLSITFIFILLFGLFTALSLSHLFLFLYRRTAKSSLFFSIFCFSFGSVFLVPWIGYVSSRPAASLSAHYTIPILFSTMCFALSGFVNTLFSERKTRFYIIAAICAITPISYWIHGMVGIVFMLIMTFAVMLEAIVLVIRAIVRKVKGARIIGIGILLFALFVFFNALYLSVFHDISFEGESIWEMVFILILAMAVLSIPVSMSLYLAWNYASVNKELTANLEHVKELSEKTIAQELEKTRIIEGQNEQLEKEVAVRTAEVITQKEKIEKQHDELKIEKQKSDDLLLNILPEEVAAELKEKGYSEAKSFNDVTVLFTDFVNFTTAGEHMGPQQLVDELHICFKTFDEICAKHGIEKIKTIGDAYLAVGGLPIADANHAVNTVNAAIEILDFMNARKLQLKEKTFDIRIGVHSGSVVAGIVGIKKFAYDIWGDTVNTAARMEQNSEPGKINVSESTYRLVKDVFTLTHRGKIQAKNKGELNMYFVDGKK